MIEQHKQFYTPAEAVKYLEEERGIKLSVAALRMRRFRNKAKANWTQERITIWTKDELDTIQPARKPAKQADPPQENA